MVDVFVEQRDLETIECSIPIDGTGGLERERDDRRRSPWPWIAGAAAVGLLGVLAVPSLHGGGTETAPSTTAPPTPTSTPTSVASTTVEENLGPILDEPPDEPPVPADTRVIGGRLPMGGETGLVVYWQRYEGDRMQLHAYDLDTGVDHRIDIGPDFNGWAATQLGSSMVFGGSGVQQLTTQGFVELVDATASAGFADTPPFAPGPGATIWIQSESGLTLVDEARQVLEEIPVTPSVLMYGSTADGRPVVRGPDERSSIVAADGTFAPLSTGRTTWVDRGRYVETTCETPVRCRSLAVGPNGPVPIEAVPAADVAYEFAFADDGSSMTIVDSRQRSISLVDLATGTIGAVEILAGEFSCCATSWGVGRTVIALPGGLGYAVSTVRGMRLVDRAGALVAAVPLPGLEGQSQILGIGRGTGWPERGGIDPVIAGDGVERRIGPLVPFTRFTGLRIHVATYDSFGAGVVATYDVDAGTIHELGDDLTARSNSQVVDNGDAVLLTSDGVERITSDGTSSAPASVIVDRISRRPVAAGPDGSTWVQLSSSPRLVLVDRDGRPTAERALDDRYDLRGSTADGEPIVADDITMGSWILGRDGLEAFSTQPIGWVEGGNYAERRCNELGCTVVAHIGDRVLDLAQLGIVDGTVRITDVYVSDTASDLIAVVDEGRLTLATSDGFVHPVDLDGVACCLQRLSPGGVRFLPDGLGVVVQLDSGLAIVARAGEVVADVDVPTTSPGFTQVLGVTVAGRGVTG
jgi:hypothetical protein